MSNPPNPWPYYRQVEQQVAEVAQVVQLVPANGPAFGNRMAELLVVIGSEIDTNLRIVTKAGKKGTMIQYRAYLKKHCPRIIEIHFKVEGLDAEPFFPFPAFDCPPSWWTAYNQVKHNRYAHAADANLTNLMRSFAALYLVDLFLSFDTPFMGQGYDTRFVEDTTKLFYGKNQGFFSKNRDHLPVRWYFDNSELPR